MSVENHFPYRVVSGFRPTRSLHLGHYEGVIRDLLRVQYARREAVYLFVADHHARSKWEARTDFAELGRNSLVAARGLLALGLDPNYCVIYRQSDISELFEIMWFCAGLLGDSWLRKQHAFKSQSSPTVGLYLYPLLMVSDILSLKASHVAIGGDQKQHLELAREIAKKLIGRFGVSLLPIPEPLNPDLVVVPGIDSQDTPKKMAIENGNDIPLFAEEDVIQERIDAIVTRPIQWGDPLPTEGCNILTYAACIAGAKAKDEFRENYGSGHYGYKNAKQDLRDLFFRTFSDARRRYSELSDGKVQEVLAFGATKARDQLTEVLFDLRETVAGS